ncbi:DUF2586 family protein [Tenacibaculum maritimum]|uniref:DUF2586 family protein n=1 Tax=Tenacibaculum maritimum TaxID=107401 RepID=UPI003876096C
MSFNGVVVNQLNGGLKRQSSTNDGTCLLIIKGAVAATGLALKSVAKLLTTDNAEALGITPSYDDTNSILAHYHIDEFFRNSPNGELYIILDDGTLTDDQVKIILRTNPDIHFASVVRNSNTPIILSDEIGKYQIIVNDLKADGIHFDGFLIEGNEFEPAKLVASYSDLRLLEAPNVSVVISQDPIIRNIKSAYQTHASIGAALGMLSVRRVNENLGSVDIERKPLARRGSRDYSLTDRSRKRFLSAVLQNGVNVDILSKQEQMQLTKLGYIYAATYQGYAGVYFNGSPTCVSANSDYAYIENNRVWGKAARLLVNALMPRIKGNLLKDPRTGFIREIEAVELEAIANKAILSMASSGEISGSDVYINPNQALTENTPLIIKISLVINDIIYEMNIDLGLTKNIG